MTNLTIQLEPRSIAVCPHLPPKLQFMETALQHQVDVFQQAKDHDIILDLAPTGTGKTKAGLSVLLHNPNRNAIYIAPTNALIEQQTKAAQKFIKEANLPHFIKAASAKDIKKWPNERVGKRSGEKLYNVLREPTTIFPECQNQPILLVTNPDIFYYAAFFQYNRLDRSNIASEFYNSFSTVIFDEFHLYDAKQLVSLFFYLAVSKVFGYFQHNRKIVMLTATPEPACEAALKTLEMSGAKIARLDGQESQENLIPSQTAVNLELRKQLDKESLIQEIGNLVIQKIEKYPDCNGAVILDSKDTLNRISDLLRNRGFENYCGRITGDIKQSDRHTAAQKQVILATNTVDVGFNFEKEQESPRQNLDWLIFSSRDRSSFWQRIGRVGRVLGKSETNIASEAIAYLPEQAWEQGITELNCSGGRNALTERLEKLDCMQRPFLEVYWRSEAFLEIARPLLELEIGLYRLPEEKLIIELFETLKTVLGGSRSWKYYKFRMWLIKIAEQTANKKIKPLKKDEWSFVQTFFKQPGYYRREFVKKFLECNHPDLLNKLNNSELTIKNIEQEFKEVKDSAKELQEYANFFKTSYAPLFNFRDSLFENVKIYDPHNFLLDKVGETNLDPIHLLRFYEFADDGNQIILTHRAKQTYELKFSLRVPNLEDFDNNYLGKLYAFENCQIQRSLNDTTRPTSLIKEIEKQLMPGVIVKLNRKNRWAICKLQKQGLDCYKINIQDYFDSPDTSEDYRFFPSLSGILAIATAGFALKCPDNTDFWCV